MKFGILSTTNSKDCASQTINSNVLFAESTLIGSTRKPAHSMPSALP